MFQRIGTERYVITAYPFLPFGSGIRRKILAESNSTRKLKHLTIDRVLLLRIAYESRTVQKKFFIQERKFRECLVFFMLLTNDGFREGREGKLGCTSGRQIFFSKIILEIKFSIAYSKMRYENKT